MPKARISDIQFAKCVRTMTGVSPGQAMRRLVETLPCAKSYKDLTEHLGGVLGITSAEAGALVDFLRSDGFQGGRAVTEAKR